MKILVIGGTRYFGIHMVNELLSKGHEVTIATRGNAIDSFGDKVKRIIFERTKEESVRETLSGTHYDVVIDKIAYCSNDIKYVMDIIDCDKYIYMSSTSVYEPKHINTVEGDFDGIGNELIWCDRKAFSYEQIKRQAEYALWQQYAERNWVAVRYPFAIGKDDYTKRLLFYVEHTMKSIPMNIDNIDYQMSYIRSDEAGKFLAFLVDKDFTGAINGASDGTISIGEVIGYVEEKTGNKAIINVEGEEAPYNGEPEYSICTDKAKSLGYQFTELKDWIYELLDYYIQVVKDMDKVEGQ
ncbi:MAG: NAD-dependent epimerase/dehydratase family protein [Lachnospiraceae bacterium]|nr:NAD-dependent epimerase/dehydratase family protein [Lachnospiraceae bacterium]